MIMAKSGGYTVPTRDEIDIDIAGRVEIPSHDGVALISTLFTPNRKRYGTEWPSILIRTPYGRKGLGFDMGVRFAENGFAAVVQDTRGRFGSGGDFFPVLHERADGAATLAWMKAQSWSNGKVGAYGVSYLGLTSFAAAGGAGNEVCDAIVPVMASSTLYSVLYKGSSAHSGGSPAHDLVARWLWIVLDVLQEKSSFAMFRKMFFGQQSLQDELNVKGNKPLFEMDERMFDANLDFYKQVIVADDVEDEFWDDKNVLCDLSDPSQLAHTHIVAGWQDFFLQQSFVDFQNACALVTSGKSTKCVRMTVGPWSHWAIPAYSPTATRIALEHFGTFLRSDEIADDSPKTLIRFAVLNSDKWYELETWPPSEATVKAYHLHGGDSLSLEDDGFEHTTTATSHVYDPEDPTPHVGGASFDFMNSGRMNQSTLESREDVVHFTTDEAAKDLEIVGEVFLDVYVSTDNAHTDLFVKLCDVDPSGVSHNVMEQFVRCTPATLSTTEVTLVRVDVGPIALLIKKNHKIRLQISGGAHPMILRHHGTEEHFSDASSTKKAIRSIHHSAEHPSVLYLPFVNNDARGTMRSNM